MKEIFMVQLDWSTTDSDGIDTELYDYGDAYDRYKEIKRIFRKIGCILANIRV